MAVTALLTFPINLPDNCSVNKHRESDELLQDTGESLRVEAGVAPVEPVVPGVRVETSNEWEDKNDERVDLDICTGVGVHHGGAFEVEDGPAEWERVRRSEGELPRVGEGKKDEGELSERHEFTIMGNVDK